MFSALLRLFYQQMSVDRVFIAFRLLCRMKCKRDFEIFDSYKKNKNEASTMFSECKSREILEAS